MPKSGHTPGQSPIRATFAALALAACLPALAFGQDIERSVPGRVISIEDAGGFDTVARLAQRGLRVDTMVTVSYTLDGDADGTPQGGGTSYANGLRSIAVTGGLYQASYDLTAFGAGPSSVTCVDGATDSYAFDAPTGSDSGDVLRGGAEGAPLVFSMRAEDPSGAAMGGEEIDHDLLGFPAGAVTVTVDGDAGRLVVEIGEPEDAALSALCRSGQLAAASTYAGANLKCRAKRASKPSTADLGGEKEARCLARARNRFEKAFSKAAVKAKKKDGSCVLDEDDTVRTADSLGTALAALTDELLFDADRLDKADRALRGALLKAASAQAAKDLKAYAKHAKRPNKTKLDVQLLKNRDKTLKAVGKALDKAEAQDIPLGGLTPLGVATSVRALVDEFVRSVGGA